ncbi:hypothetical protein ACWTQY_31640, partial [Klebsiella pneumoniae]
ADQNTGRYQQGADQEQIIDGAGIQRRVLLAGSLGAPLCMARARDSNRSLRTAVKKVITFF